MAEQDSTTLILVRHGETEWNLAGRIQGHQDSALTERGLEQGRRAARRLTELSVSAIYASDADRARRTGEILAAPHGLEVVCRADLRERCYGALEGLTVEEARARDREAVDCWLGDRQRLAPPGGETQPELARRVVAGLGRIAADHPGETVVVATHGGPIKSTVFDILTIPIASWDRTWVSNGSITVLRVKTDAMRLAAFNDTCHLKHDLSPTRGIEN